MVAASLASKDGKVDERELNRMANEEHDEEDGGESEEEEEEEEGEEAEEEEEEAEEIYTTGVLRDKGKQKQNQRELTNNTTRGGGLSLLERVAIAEERLLRSNAEEGGEEVEKPLWEELLEDVCWTIPFGFLYSGM